MFADDKFKKAIQGKTVKCVVSIDVGDGEDDGWPGLEFTDGSVLVIQCDPEGNGPGFASLTDKDGKSLGGMG